MRTDPIDDDRPALPANRAFVVHFRTDERPGGRIEHVVSGAATQFESWDHLRRFVALVLGSGTEGPVA